MIVGRWPLLGVMLAVAGCSREPSCQVTVDMDVAQIMQCGARPAPGVDVVRGISTWEVPGRPDLNEVTTAYVEDQRVIGTRTRLGLFGRGVPAGDVK